MDSLRQSFIVAFCLWHAAAVAAYALPDTLKEYPIIGPLHRVIADATHDYVLMTSQWQKWPLFAPDPLRRVVVFIIEAQNDGEWREVKRIAPETVRWSHSSTELKTIRRLEEKQETYVPIRKAYAEEVCRSEHLSPGTPVRLRIDWFVIPRHDEQQSIAWWRAWEPQWQTRIDVETTCPPLPFGT